MTRPDEPKTSADFEFERYELLREYRPENDIPDDDLLPHDITVAQGISEEDHDSETDFPEPEQIQDVPDADEIRENSPADPAAPDPDAMHGTDLLNGYDGEEDE